MSDTEPPGSTNVGNLDARRPGYHPETLAEWRLFAERITARAVEYLRDATPTNSDFCDAVILADAVPALLAEVKRLAADNRAMRARLGAHLLGEDSEEHLRRLLAWRDCTLDDPDDRLYHAEDGTWWKRDGWSLVSADPPPVIKRLTRERDEATRDLGDCSLCRIRMIGSLED